MENLMSDNTDQPTKIDRRTALKSMSVGAVGINPLTNVLKDDNNSVTITIVENRDGPFITKRVDAEWYQYEQHVEDIAKDARRELLPLPGVMAVGIGAGLNRVSGRPAGHLRVYVDKKAGEVPLPKLYQNIPIERVERGESVEFCDCNDFEYNYIPGGVKISTNNGLGSAGCEVELDGSHYLLTCAHLFPCNPSSTSDIVVGQGPNNSYFGYVDVSQSNPPHFEPNEDWALITRDSGGSASGYNHYIEDYAGKLSGHVTKDGLTDFMCSGSNNTVYKQGYRTCKDQGCIVDRDKTSGNPSCGGSTGGFIEANIHIEKGDSGGILFHQFTFNSCYYTAPIGIVSNGPDNSTNNCTPNSKPATDNIECMSSYKLYNDYDINFDPHFSQGC